MKSATDSAYRSARILYVVICFIIAGCSASTYGQSDRLPAGVELLKTSKDEMARWKTDGKREDADYYGDEYLVDGRRVRAEFASERCSWHGWDVEPGTLISLTILPAEKRTIDTRKLLRSGYEPYGTDTLDVFYGNDNSGLLYFVRDFDKQLLRLTFYPSRSAGKRCKRFPEFRVLPQAFNSYHTFDDIGDLDSWDVGLLGDLVGRLYSDSTLNGFIFIYSKNPCAKSVSNLTARMEKWLFDANKMSPDRIKILTGGVRDENTIELYLMKATSPPPTPYARSFPDCVSGSK